MRMEHDPEGDPVILLPGIGLDCADYLHRRGIETVGDLRETSEEELMEVPGIGEGKLRFVKEFIDQ